MALSNHERVGKALEVLKAGLAEEQKADSATQRGLFEKTPIIKHQQYFDSCPANRRILDINVK